MPNHIDDCFDDLVPDELSIPFGAYDEGALKKQHEAVWEDDSPYNIFNVRDYR
jgi:hypothetical protein